MKLKPYSRLGSHYPLVPLFRVSGPFLRLFFTAAICITMVSYGAGAGHAADKPARDNRQGILSQALPIAIGQDARGQWAASTEADETSRKFLLRTELKSLLSSHPRLLSARERLRSIREQERRAFSGFLPNVTLSGDAGREVVDSPGTRSNFGEPTREYRQKATLTVTQNLFNGYATTSANDAAIARTEVARANLNSVTQTLIFEGISAYYTVLKQRALVSLATENEKILKRQLALEDERVERGSGIAVDVLLAKTRLQLAVEQRVQFSGALEAASARYLQVFAQLPDVARMQHPVALKALLPEDLDQAIEDANRFNPSLLSTDQQIVAARHDKIGARSGYYPSVDLVASGNWEKDFDGVIGVRRDWSGLLRVSWNIFSGYLTEATATAAAIEQSVAQNNHLDNTRRVVENLRIAWQQFNTARERVRLLNNAVVIAEEVFISRKRLRDSGRETALNVLDAQREVFAARINQVAARYDAEIAAFAVMFSTGMLTPQNLGL